MVTPTPRMYRRCIPRVTRPPYLLAFSGSRRYNIVYYIRRYPEKPYGDRPCRTHMPSTLFKRSASHSRVNRMACRSTTSGSRHSDWSFLFGP